MTLFWVYWKCHRIFGNSGLAIAHSKSTGHEVECVRIIPIHDEKEANE